MTAPTIISTVEDRSKVLNDIIDLDLNGKQWEVAIKRHRKRRSNKQSNLYHMWIDEIVPYVSGDTGYEKDQVKKVLQGNFLPAIKLEMGGLAAEDYSTKDLNTQEMSQYCDRIHRWASGFGIVLPLPPERGYDGDGRPLAPERIDRANGQADDWRTLVMDLEAAIELADNGDRLVEITVVNQDDLDAMKEHSPEHYTRVMRAMESRGEDLNRAPG